jgi:hypothetical protein
MGIRVQFSYMSRFALIHSPLVGPFSWQPAAAALRARGHTALVPAVHDAPGHGPYWRQHAQSAADALSALPDGVPLVLVAHSGAGALLPALSQALGAPPAAYIYVDAVLPSGGGSRLEGFGPPDEMARFRAYLEGGGRFPAWTDADLAAEIPDAQTRARLLAEVRPRGLDYWTEPIPRVSGWPDAPGAYLRFTPTYAPDAERARLLGWPVRHLPGGHFQALTAPERVAAAIDSLYTEFAKP